MPETSNPKIKPIYINKPTVEKSVQNPTADMITGYSGAAIGRPTGMFSMKNTPRGINVYSLSQLMGVSGATKDNQLLTTTYEMPWFILTITEREDIFRLCSPVFGIITGRMNRISGLDWKIVADSREEDKIANELKMYNGLWHEFKDDVSWKGIGVKIKCLAQIRRRLPLAKDDLSNFHQCLLRWSRKIKEVKEDKATEIEDWMRHPNQEDNFIDFTKKQVQDLCVHGTAAVYRQVIKGRIENIYELPGGSVYPIKNKYVGQGVGYVQIVDGAQPQIMFQNEISFLRYAPRSANAYGGVPLEALVNKIAETLFFDQRAAEFADGTKPPEKLLAFGERSPWGNVGQEMEVPLDASEEKRIEAMVNEVRKDSIRVITGYGTPVVVDTSRENVFPFQNERQKQIREEVAIVFGASNNEINLTGSEGTSGRNTSEVQERYDKYKGLLPIMQILEAFWNDWVIPFRYPGYYHFNFEPSMNEMEKLTEFAYKQDHGLNTPNEIRIERGLDPFEDADMDKPKGGSISQPGSEQGNPLFIKGMEDR